LYKNAQKEAIPVMKNYLSVGSNFPHSLKLISPIENGFSFQASLICKDDATEIVMPINV